MLEVSSTPAPIYLMPVATVPQARTMKNVPALPRPLRAKALQSRAAALGLRQTHPRGAGRGSIAQSTPPQRPSVEGQAGRTATSAQRQPPGVSTHHHSHLFYSVQRNSGVEDLITSTSVLMKNELNVPEPKESMTGTSPAPVISSFPWEFTTKPQPQDFGPGTLGQASNTVAQARDSAVLQNLDAGKMEAL